MSKWDSYHKRDGTELTPKEQHELREAFERLDIQLPVQLWDREDVE